MPALRLRELQLPELHLPEMSRDDVVRVINDARREVPKVDLPDVDIPRAIATAVEATGIRRDPRRSRLPFVIGGLITLGLVGFALLTSPLVRPRLADLGQKVKLRLDARRSTEDAEAGSPDARAFDSAVAVQIEPAAFAEAAPADGSPFDGPSDLPKGLGADQTPAETTARG